MAADLIAARLSAERFRERVITGRPFDNFPVDSFFIADNILRIDLIPFPNLENLLDSPAAIKPNLREMYVDDDLFGAYGDRRAKPWELNRLRFSIAHELGHIEMHANRINEVRCNEIDDLMELFNRKDGPRYCLEQEANEFAGRLIAPVEKLREALEGFRKLQTEPRWRDSAELRAQFAQLVGRSLGLNEEGMRTRLDRDEIWPAEWTEGG